MTVETGCVRDVMGRAHPVDGYGELIAKNCRVAVASRELTSVMAELSGTPAEQVETALLHYAQQLHSRNLISVHQSFLVELYWEFVLWPTDLMLLLGTRRMPPPRFSSRRIYPSTVLHLARAVVESFSFLTVASLCLTFVVIAATLILDPLVPRLDIERSGVLALVAASATLLVLLAAFVHEMGHLLACRLLGIPVLGIQARRGATSVLMPRARGRQLRAAVLAGPAAGALFCMASAAVALGIPSPGWQFATIDNVRLSLGLVSLLIGVAQLVSLLPLAGDGRALRDLGRERR
ncbi:hypothetical protein CMN_00481 [Clavibacter nebraskensis NCPPB 2581]|uniref:Uncharacterized protein n=1 Tax=Clavibacter nebraskensis NCPPB 2581 TaxID=1097677 RepID=A0AAI9EJE5_9MICO|nr:hypothetical protein CMN_00481 [Clavibacter nebraskensis NCPPB 2581]